MGGALVIRELSKTFPGQRALDRVSMEIEAGEVHGLVGQNGSGKSTLIKVLAGYHDADEGEVELDGEVVDLRHADAAWRRRLHFLHQDLGLVPTLDAVENLALGSGYDTGAGGRIRWRAEVRRARTLLGEFGEEFDVRIPVARLSAAQRTIVAIMRALQRWDDSEFCLLVLDEPTASLSSPEVTQLFEAIRSVAARGAGVIFVSHRLHEVFEITDRVTVLRDGRQVATETTRDLNEARLVELIVGRKVADLYAPPPPPRDDVVLSVRGLCGATVVDAHFDLHRGEILGIAGLAGSGRDEIGRLLFGARQSDAGSVRVNNGALNGSSPRDALANGVGYVPSDRLREGVIPAFPVRENLTLPDLSSLRRRAQITSAISRRRERREVLNWIDRLEIRPPRPEGRLQELSGGNQQRVVLAKWLRTNPQVLVLDEPTQGVDVGAKAHIYDVLASAAAEGVAIVVASSDADELAHICDRVVVFCRGRIAAELTGDQLTEDCITTEAFGRAPDARIHGDVA